MLSVSLLKAIGIIMASDFKQEFSNMFFPLLLLLVANTLVANTTKDSITFLLCYSLCTAFVLEFMYNIIAPILNYREEIENNLDLR